MRLANMRLANLSLDGFSYSAGELHCEGVALSQIAEDCGTPTYVYSKAAIVNRVRRLQTALSSVQESADCAVHFAVKACSNIHVLSLLQRLGCGADIVSAGELFRASVAQIAPEHVIFSGVGKSEREIAEALKARIAMFNVESLSELVTLDRMSAANSTRARVSLRINPDVDAKTHPHISTGLKRNKFGLAKSELKEVYRNFKSFSNLDFVGLSCHIGSQILSRQPFIKAWTELLNAAKQAPFEVTHLDLGGGLGICHGKDREFSLEEYGALVGKIFKGTPYKLSIEPGRALIGPAALLLSRLLVTKKRTSRTFYVIDAAMNDLIRPALYGSVHPALAVKPPRTRKTIQADLVGPVCESADTFELNAKLPALEQGALLAFANSGAYGMSMASQYNSRPRAAEVLVDGTSYQVIRNRETYADLIEKELF